MKNKIANYLKLGTLLLGVSLLLWNCDKEEILVKKEEVGNSNFHRISLKEFNRRIEKSKDFSVFKKILSPKRTYQNKSASKKMVITTDEIVMIVRESKTFYTFKLTNNTDANSFYNLIIIADAEEQILDYYILKYTPEKEWLQDVTNPFKGYISIVNNVFTIQEIETLLYSKISQKTLENCIYDISTFWKCSNDNVGHGPSPRSNGCVALSFDFIIEVEPILCSDGGGGNGESGSLFSDGNTNVDGCTTCGSGGVNGNYHNVNLRRIATQKFY